MGTPTITMAFNMEIIHWADAIINVTDTGGNEAWLRPLWKHHFPNKQALVLVVDSTDDVRMGNPTDVPDPGGGQAQTAARRASATSGGNSAHSGEEAGCSRLLERRDR